MQELRSKGTVGVEEATKVAHASFKTDLDTWTTISDSKEDKTSTVLLCWVGGEDFVPEINFPKSCG